MTASFTVEFAKSICRFESFGSSFFCDNWQWKLDPFRCSVPDRGSYEVILRNAYPEEIFSDIAKKVYEVQNGFFLQQVFSLADGGTLWRYMRKVGKELLLSYYVNNEWSEIVLLEDHTSSGGNMAFEYLCHIMPPCGLKLGMLTFHGVLMEYEGNGLIISAPSGTGKTTHARLWRDNRHALIINGDRAVCRKVDGIWTGFGLPWSGTSGEQINRNVPIKAMVILKRSGENQAFRISGIDAFGAALPNVLSSVWDAGLTERAIDLLDDFLQTVPVIELQCRPDPASVDVLLKTLEELE